LKCLNLALALQWAASWQENCDLRGWPNG
jgi:hypothetical protein